MVKVKLTLIVSSSYRQRALKHDGLPGRRKSLEPMLDGDLVRSTDSSSDMSTDQILPVRELPSQRHAQVKTNI